MSTMLRTVSPAKVHCIMAFSLKGRVPNSDVPIQSAALRYVWVATGLIGQPLTRVAIGPIASVRRQLARVNLRNLKMPTLWIRLCRRESQPVPMNTHYRRKKTGQRTACKRPRAVQLRSALM
jgi:hypothetical protein